jgi:hypothetical protein
MKDLDGEVTLEKFPPRPTNYISNLYFLGVDMRFHDLPRSAK